MLPWPGNLLLNNCGIEPGLDGTHPIERAFLQVTQSIWQAHTIANHAQARRVRIQPGGSSRQRRLTATGLPGAAECGRPPSNPSPPSVSASSEMPVCSPQRFRIAELRLHCEQRWRPVGLFLPAYAEPAARDAPALTACAQRRPR
jgi:hypothetical protein